MNKKYDYEDPNYDAYSDGYERGYDAGYIAGYTARLQQEAQKKEALDKCPKCGITLTNPMGYVCASINCPVFYKATC